MPYVDRHCCLCWLSPHRMQIHIYSTFNFKHLDALSTKSFCSQFLFHTHPCTHAHTHAFPPIFARLLSLSNSKSSFKCSLFFISSLCLSVLLHWSLNSFSLFLSRTHTPKRAHTRTHAPIHTRAHFHAFKKQTRTQVEFFMPSPSIHRRKKPKSKKSPPPKFPKKTFFLEIKKDSLDWWWFENLLTEPYFY